MLTEERTLPAGLLDSGSEIFFKDGELYATHAGQVWRFEEFPSALLDEIQNALDNDPEACRLLDRFGPKPAEDRLFLYAKCRWGGFDYHPDFIDGQLSTEAWNCQCNGSCILQARFRKGVETNHGVLTRREMEVIRTICTEPFPTSYAAAINLDISGKTLDNHKQSIFNKTGVHSMQELTSLAINQGWL